MWLRLMAVAFFANGLGPFGLRVLADRGLLARWRLPYLALWYAGGLALAGLAFLRKPEPICRSEIKVGVGMAACSLAGQLATALALESIAGHIAFAVTTGGNLFIVAAAGILIFRERVNWYGAAGTALGFASLIMLGWGS
jgi:multidrug transporter EmrE-like cation transporter